MQPFVRFNLGFERVQLPTPNAGAMIPDSQIELGSGIALVGGLSNPPKRLAIVLGHAFPFGIHQPEIELRQGMILFGRLSVPLGCLCEILQASWGRAVIQSESELRVSIALVGLVPRCL